METGYSLDRTIIARAFIFLFIQIIECSDPFPLQTTNNPLSDSWKHQTTYKLLHEIKLSALRDTTLV